MTDITELAQLRGRTVYYPYYLVECDCGKIYPSSELSGGEPMGESGDYSDCYCPHCGEGEEHFAECADPETAWKAQQDKIDALVEALEKAQEHIARQEQIILNQDESLSIRRGELEARDKQVAKDVQIKARLCRESNSLHDRLREAENRIAELDSRTVKLPRPGFITISGEHMAVYMKGEVVAALLAAGIKVEAG
ncbi:hypothetical protein [Klebsiella michiganensis]|uniref:hypothetical protein n=1 Tax=Klebsiella michiganensis TaxID=1134687 RepID=UPI0023A9A2C9|nr:hypothetical protein [Klebsiella michiganensis]MDD9638913.1 hypothetical protein [Klebsiella michiganensis]